jgi:hypothetical protein
MTTLLNHALSAASTGAPPDPTAKTQRPATLLVAGAGGPLGSAVLEHLLAGRRFAGVRVLVTQALQASVNGLETLIVAPFDDGGDTGDRGDSGAAPIFPAIADTALIVFDVKRHANGREEAFLRPEPRTLPRLAGWLRACGVRDLVVVMPHNAASLPQALKAGLADLDEHAVVELGFEHVVFVRSARMPVGARSNEWLQRVADGVLAQLRMMTPQADQPVRSNKVAQFVSELALQLPRSTPGTRVAAPELVWQAAQHADASALVRAWLAGEALPAASAKRMRL